MTRHRAALAGLCLLCALGFGAFAAQGASAVVKGTTAFTCKEKEVQGGAGFFREHCKPVDEVLFNANYEHVSIAENTVTEAKVTNEKTDAETEGPTPFKMKTTIGGVEAELQATGVAGCATIVNKKAPTGEHFAEGETNVCAGAGAGEPGVVFTGVKVTKPAASGCIVRTEAGGALEKVDTKKLTGTTKEQMHAVKFAPAAGNVLAAFVVEKCKLAALNGVWEAKGSVKSTTIEGSTVDFTIAETLAQNTLTLRGQNAGIEGSITFSGKLAADPAFTPLSPTTVETP
jgi:hypothetical protein